MTDKEKEMVSAILGVFAKADEIDAMIGCPYYEVINDEVIIDGHFLLKYLEAEIVKLFDDDDLEKTVFCNQCDCPIKVTMKDILNDD